MRRIKEEAAVENGAANTPEVATNGLELAKAFVGGGKPAKEKKEAPPPPDSVTDLSLKLADTTKEADKASINDKARALVFESVNAPKELPLPAALDALVVTTWIPSNLLVSTVKRLRDDLALQDKRGEHGHLNKANDLAESNRHEAFRAWSTAKSDLEKWERSNEVIFSTLRNEANKALQREKDLGYRSKQITDKDTESKMAELFPDEFRAQEGRRSDAKMTVDALQDLFLSWESRCRTLNSMLQKSR